MRACGLALLLGCLSACASGGRTEHAFTGETMGTHYVVKVVGAIALGAASTLETRIASALDDVDAKMSTYREDSELSRFNRHGSTDPVLLSEKTAEVFRVALAVGRESGGAFDITVGPLVDAWGFGPETAQSPPNDATLEALRAHVGYRHLELDRDGRLRKGDPQLACDLSAVAKGYGVDAVAQVLDAAGQQNYLVEVGGEVRAQGVNTKGKPWRIGIEKPLAGGRTLQHVVALRDQALATSGDYRNFYEKDGKRFSHTIDPRTGRPVTHRLASASVIHKECVWADAYATAIMVLGPEAGLTFAKEANLAAFLVVREASGDFTTHTAPAFDALPSP